MEYAPPPPLFSRRIWAARTAGACIALLSLLIIAGCEVQDNTPTDTPDDSPQGIYTCDKGTPVMGTPNSATDVEMCAECDDTYHKEGDTDTCVANEYACSNGDAAEGRPATHNEQKCDTCDDTYHREGDTCVANAYACSNGDAEEGQPATHNEPQCAACDPGYRLENDACSEGIIGNACDTNNHCQSTYCDTLNNICSDGQIDTACDGNSDCESGYCSAWGEGIFEHLSTCTNGEIGSRCSNNNNCQENYYCSAPLGVCTTGVIGSGCSSDDRCGEGTCIVSKCSDGTAGSGCTDNSNCNSGTCITAVCQ